MQRDAGADSADVIDGGGVVKKIAIISAAARAPEAANRAWLCGALRVPVEENKKSLDKARLPAGKTERGSVEK